MSFKQRERKRRKKAALSSSRLGSRQSSSPKWWLTIVTRKTCCARCSGVLREGSEMVYRHAPREALCVLCAEGDPEVRYRPSMRWERAHPKGRRAGR